MTETLGVGKAGVGLSPGAASSVEPSGMAPLFEGFIDPGAVAVAPPPEAPELQFVDAAELDANPPPSNVELEVPAPAPVAGQDAISGIGLKPAEFSPVAPSGIPLEDGGALKFIVPSGDVTPNPGVELTCAEPVLAPLSQMIAAMIMIRPIGASIFRGQRIRITEI